MIKFLKNILPPQFIRFLQKYDIFDVFMTSSNISYSQYGEDLILKTVLLNGDKGFYLDVGAHHPKKFSNTYFFYKRGWSGINIDAMPGTKALFDQIRPRDINLEIGIAKEKKEMTFFIFAEPLYNTFDEELARQRHRDEFSEIVKEQKIITKTLEEVLKENLPDGQKINFLSIDIEGLDKEVLYSNNWQLYRPEYILVEWFDWNIEQVKSNELYQFLNEKQYVFFAKTMYTVIFVAGELIVELRKRGICG